MAASQGMSKSTGKRGTPFQKGNQAARGKGRPKGSRTKAEQVAEILTSAAITEGLMPLEFFLQVMRDARRGFNLRMDAAKAAAPYVHKRQPIAVEHIEQEFKVFDITKLEGLTDAELEVMHGIMVKAAAAAAKEANNPFLPDPRVISQPMKAIEHVQHERGQIIDAEVVEVSAPRTGPRPPWEVE